MLGEHDSEMTWSRIAPPCATCFFLRKALQLNKLNFIFLLLSQLSSNYWLFSCLAGLRKGLPKVFSQKTHFWHCWSSLLRRPKNSLTQNSKPNRFLMMFDRWCPKESRVALGDVLSLRNPCGSVAWFVCSECLSYRTIRNMSQLVAAVVWWKRAIFQRFKSCLLLLGCEIPPSLTQFWSALFHLL